MTYANSRGLEGFNTRVKGAAPKKISMRRWMPPQKSLASSGLSMKDIYVPYMVSNMFITLKLEKTIFISR